MFIYPYNFIMVDNSDNSDSIYRYEYFTGGLFQFKIRSVATTAPQMQLFPYNYKGLTENLEESLYLTGYPQCAWVTDVYANWLAQKTASNAIGGTTNN